MLLSEFATIVGSGLAVIIAITSLIEWRLRRFEIRASEKIDRLDADVRIALGRIDSCNQRLDEQIKASNARFDAVGQRIDCMCEVMMRMMEKAR